MNLHLGLFGVVVALVCGLGGFIGSVAAIVHYLVRPIVRFLDEWRTVPADLRKLRDLLTTHLEREEEQWPPVYRRRETARS